MEANECEMGADMVSGKIRNGRKKI